MNKLRDLCLCVVTAFVLGFFLAALASSAGDKALAAEKAADEKLYADLCGACHPGGGNIMNAALPVAGSSRLQSLDAFGKFNRKPVKPDGSKGDMPAFSKEDLSDQDMKMIYEYAKQLPPIKN
jgi:mono/diheme cytochrome c family protein